MSLRLAYRSRHVQLMMEWRMEQEFKMPPPGITETRYILGGRRYIKYTLRCDADGCWLVADGLSDKNQADKYLADHKAGGSYSIPSCPAPPRREVLPSGLKDVEKLWREMDELIEAIADNKPYNGMGHDELKGFARGLAFCIVLLEHPVFQDARAVAAHARDRRKMRLGEIEYSPTPSRYSPQATVQQNNALHDDGAVTPTVKSPAKKTIPESIRKAIEAGMASGMFSAAELAETYRLPVAEVHAIAGK